MGCSWFQRNANQRSRAPAYFLGDKFSRLADGKIAQNRSLFRKSERFRASGFGEFRSLPPLPGPKPIHAALRRPATRLKIRMNNATTSRR